MSADRRSKGAAKRDHKRITRRTMAEVQAFERGMHTHREVLGPRVKRRAALFGGVIGLILGAGGAAGAYFLLGL